MRRQTSPLRPHFRARTPRLRAVPSPFFLTALLLTPFHIPWVAAGTSPKTVQVFRTDQEIRLDGRLEEESWALALPADDFIQQDPRVGEPATERTEVRILLTDKSLYLGVRCWDSDPSGIIARERRRDDRLSGDDRFEVVLDTFHDHRNAFYFVTNPLGTRYDALITDEGIELNDEWDERWWVEARIDSQGWTLEIEIPLNTLRSDPHTDLWGINFKRFIRRKNETAQWAGWSRDFSFTQVSQAGHLAGMLGVRTGIRSRVKPYLLGGFRRTLGDQRSLHEVGLEVAKLGITPGLVAEFTWNTDFAQAEVDEAVVNLTRFPLFFPEKREFFLEGAGNFDFSLGGRRGGGTERVLQMYFSRRIGLTPDRRPIPVVGGAKVTGRVGGLDLGFLNVQTEDFENLPGNNYTVLRLKKNVLARSNFGFFFTNRRSGRPGDYNRVAGAEVNFTFFRNLDLQASLAGSFTPGAAGDQKAGRLKFNYFSDAYELFFEHLHIGDAFRHDIGFVQRRGIRRNDAVFVWEPRPDALGIRRLSIRNELVYLTDLENRLLTREQIFQASVHFHSGDTVRFNTTHNLERLEEDFRLAPEVVVPLDTYGFRNYNVEYRSSPQRSLSALTRYGWGEFFDGRRRFLRLEPTLKPFSQFSMEFGYEYNDISLPRGAFTTHVVNTRLNVNFSNRWLTTSLIQYDSESQRWVLFLRLRFIYRPGDDLFIVFNRTSPSPTSSQPADRALLIKLTHSFDF